MLITERALKGPLGALRIAIEGARGNAEELPPAFLDRALDAVNEIDHAAADFMAWAHPRPLRPVACGVTELISSLRQTLDADTEARCHFVVDSAWATMSLDGRLLVTALERSIRRRLDPARCPVIPELMIHAHEEDGWTTISLIDTDVDSELDIAREAASSNAEALADALLTRDCERLGGRVSIHETGGHRCVVVVLPSNSQSPVTGEEASA